MNKNKSKQEDNGAYTVKNDIINNIPQEELAIVSKCFFEMLDCIEVFDYDEDLTVQYVSHGFELLTGCAARDIIGKSMNKLLAQFTHRYNDVLTDAKEQIELKGSFCVEYILNKKDGTPVYVLQKGMLINCEDSTKKVYCIFFDITEQRNKDSVYAENNFRLNVLINSLEAGVFSGEYNKDFPITYANDGFYHMLGYTHEQFQKEKNNLLGSLIYPDDVDDMLCDLTEQLKTSIKTFHMNRLIRRDGTFIWVLASGVVLKRVDGSAEFHGVITDFTRQKEQEDALILSERRYQLVMENINEDVFDYMHETKRIINYAGSEERYGLPTAIEGGCETIIAAGRVHPSSVENFRQLYKKIDDGEKSASEIIVTIDKDGKEIVNNFVIINIFDKTGKPTLAVGLISNITEAMALERELSFRRVMTAGQTFTYEANVTQNKVISCDKMWEEALGVTDISSYSGLIDYVSENVIHPDSIDAFRNFSSAEEINREFVSGFSHIVMEYRRRKAKDGEYIWAENRMNIIRDEVSNDIKIRCFVTDITRQKEKESQLMEEQAFFDAISFDAMLTYEVDITSNKLISGQEHWYNFYGVRPTDNYTEMMNLFTKKVVYKDDKEQFIDTFNRKTILNKFKEGENELYCEYRRPNETGEAVWVACTMHLYEDPHTGNLRARAYVEDIDAEKKTELALIYKSEHDLLTGVYNKMSAQEQIQSFLSTSEGRAGKHALFVLDIDRFKQMNDIFGHAFGDVVLSQLAGKLKELFREADIIGRVGGDEFIVFMKNIAQRRNVEDKAREMCEYCAESYTQKGIPYRITLSVGISFYPCDGKSYTALFDSADTALYSSKDNGRDQYAIYNKDMCFHESVELKIDDGDMVEAKQFNQHISDYVFRILYESADKESALATVMELLGKHYTISRAYVFEKMPSGTIKNTYQWCDKGISKMAFTSNELVYGEKSNLEKNFSSDGIYSLPYINKAEPKLRSVLEKQGVKSMLQFSIIKDGEFAGLVGFDECKYVRMPSQDEITELHSIASTIGIFINEMRATQKLNIMQKVNYSILDAYSSYVYICDPESYKILFINDAMKRFAPNVKEGDICYKAYWNKRRPCNDCPLINLNTIGESKKFAVEHENQMLGVWLRTTATWTDWVDDKKACLVESIDITKYKK
ncbi:MAG: diguanylate cyclase [Hydrogenoanaerobacterium sp.]